MKSHLARKLLQARACVQSSRIVGKKIFGSGGGATSECCSSLAWFNHQVKSSSSLVLNNIDNNTCWGRRAFSSSVKLFGNDRNNTTTTTIGTQTHPANALSREEELELVNNYQFLDNSYKHITKFITQFRINHPDKAFDSALFEEILKLITFCHETVPRVEPIDAKFYNSSIGMKSYVLMKKVELLLLKAVNQEWFSLEALQNGFDPKASVEPFKFMYPPNAKDDEILFLYSIYEAQLSNSAFVPQIKNMRLATKESLIAACFFAFFRLRDAPANVAELNNYVNAISTDYEITKSAYTSAKQVSNIDELRFDAHKNAYSYLGRTFTEDEFDWFEDMETDMPINLGNFIRAIKATADLNANLETADKSSILDTLEECINLEPENIYLHYMNAYCLSTIWKNVHNVDREQDLKNYTKAISSLEKAIDIMATISILPQPNLKKNNFSEVESTQQVERINDLKFTPISYLLANIYAKSAQSADSVEMSQTFGNNGLYYSRHVELFSRYPNVPYLYLTQGICYGVCGMYESSIEAYSTVDQYDFNDMYRNIIVDSFVGASNCMIDLGLADKCLETIDIYIEKYKGDPRVILQKLLCKTVLLESKDELSPLLNEVKEVRESLEKSDLQVTEPNVYYFVLDELERLEELAKSRFDTFSSP